MESSEETDVAPVPRASDDVGIFEPSLSHADVIARLDARLASR
jgi:hypothetical protein